MLYCGCVGWGDGGEAVEREGEERGARTRYRGGGSGGGDRRWGGDASGRRTITVTYAPTSQKKKKKMLTKPSTRRPLILKTGTI